MKAFKSSLGKRKIYKYKFTITNSIALVFVFFHLFPYFSLTFFLSVYLFFSLWLFFSPLPSLLKQEGREKKNEVAKIVIKSHAFLLDLNVSYLLKAFKSSLHKRKIYKYKFTITNSIPLSYPFFIFFFISLLLLLLSVCLLFSLNFFTKQFVFLVPVLCFFFDGLLSKVIALSCS